MKESETLERLEVMRRGLLEKHLPATILKQLDAIQVTIDLFKKEKDSTTYIPKLELELRNDLLVHHDKGSSASAQEKVIDSILELMEKNGSNRITSKQILDYFTKNSLFVDGWGEPSTRLGSILFSESEKKSGRIRKIKRGLWEKRYEKPTNNQQLQS
jgi:hypothetical protein